MINFLNKVAKYNDISLAIGIVTVLMFLLVPMPSFLLDIMLAFSIAVSLVILMTTLLISSPLELSAFPSLLLITTVIRLSLNVASTKLILAQGHLGDTAAGHVISAFGHFVMQGNVVIGVIIFLILTIINFVVITKGSGRIAEVAARFSLDAMPGKQMTIDSELSTGFITEEQAKRKRKTLEEESTFYGSMDGANKFVRGDAIAGLIITFINLIGGIIIGTLQRNLSLDTAVQTYSILTIGDGLACQIPSLIISLASGLLVTKAGASGSTDKAIFGQLGKKPRALSIAASLVGLIAFMPGLPFFPFIVMGASLGGLAYIIQTIAQKENQTHQESEYNKFSATPIIPVEDPVSNALKLDIIKVELGLGLLSLVKQDTQNDLTQKIKLLRTQMATKLGFILPRIRIQDNSNLEINTYLIKIKEIIAGSGKVYPGRYMVVHKTTPEKSHIDGISAVEPAFGLPATWVSEKDIDKSKSSTTLDSASVISTHITQIIKESITELLSYTDTQNLLEEVTKSHKKLVQDIIPDVITVGMLQKILQKLLAEDVSIRDLPTILEGAADASIKSKDITFITESIRTKLARQICSKHLNQSGNLPIISISDQWEDIFFKNLADSTSEKKVSLPPSIINDFVTQVVKKITQNIQDGHMPIILTSSSLRPHIRAIIAKAQPMVTVLGHTEIYSKYPIENLGTI